MSVHSHSKVLFTCYALAKFSCDACSVTNRILYLFSLLNSNYTYLSFATILFQSLHLELLKFEIQNLVHLIEIASPLLFLQMKPSKLQTSVVYNKTLSTHSEVILLSQIMHFHVVFASQ